ncbi:MAG: VWA domain-containing protein [Planctomycetota bacterium]
MDWNIGNPNIGYGFVIVVVVIVLAIYAAVVRRRQRRRFASGEAGRRLLPNSGSGAISLLLNLVALALLVVAAMDVRWGKSEREVQQTGLEIMFVLDVSNSMLAEDALPNRLTRAKQQIADLVNEMATDRIGLVVFSGTAEQVIPLTRHYDDFLATLNSVGPTSIEVGGSRLGAALEEAGKGFMDKTSSIRTIVLFTDGEDQESRPVAIAQRLKADENIRVFSIGLGDMERGAVVPEIVDGYKSPKRYKDQVVVSKLDGATLKEIADATGGTFVPAGTQQVNMAEFYHSFVANIEPTDFELARFKTYTPQFRWFAGLALLLLVVDCLWRYGRNWLPSVSSKKMNPAAAMAAIAIGLLAVNPAIAQESANEVAQRINQANLRIAKGELESAMNELGTIGEDVESYADQRDYNLGIAQYKLGNFDQASELFRKSSRSRTTDIAANSRYNLGNALVQLAGSTEETKLKQSLLSESIGHYRSAIQLDPDNRDARANIEIAYRMLKQIQQQQAEEQDQEEQQQETEEQKQEKEEQKQEEQQPKQQDEPQQTPEEQESEKPSKNDDASEDSSQDSATDEERSDGSDEQSDTENDESPGSSDAPNEESSNSDEANQPEESKDSQGTGNDSQSNQSELGSSSDSDPTDKPGQNDEDKRSPGDSNSADTEEADREPMNIDGKLTSQDSLSATQEANVLPGQPQKDQKISKEEVLRRLQAVRDREFKRQMTLRMRNRLKDQRSDANRRYGVDKDW